MNKILPFIFVSLLLAGCAGTPASQPQQLFGIDFSKQLQYPPCNIDENSNNINFQSEFTCSFEEKDANFTIPAAKDLPEGVTSVVLVRPRDEQEFPGSLFILENDTDFTALKAHLSEKYTHVSQPDPELELSEKSTLWEFKLGENEWYVLLEESDKLSAIAIAEKSVFYNI